jgi:hypothetical protein
MLTLSPLEGVLVGLVNYFEEVSPPPSGQIIVDDLIEHSKFLISFVDEFHVIMQTFVVKMQAEEYGETLGNRATHHINTAISRLVRLYEVYLTTANLIKFLENRLLYYLPLPTQ